MDEPLSSLDASLRAEMRGELVELQRRLGITTIYVTHDQTEAMTMADRIVIMMDGSAIQIGTPLDVFHNPQHITIARFLGSPTINILRGELTGQHRLAVAGHEFVTAGIADRSAVIDLGLRPEDVDLGRDGVSPTLPWRGTVRRIEQVGHEALVHVMLDGDVPVAARLTRDAMSHLSPSAGDRIRVGFRPAQVKLFDGSGARITGSIVFGERSDAPFLQAVGCRA